MGRTNAAIDSTNVCNTASEIEANNYWPQTKDAGVLSELTTSSFPSSTSGLQALSQRGYAHVVSSDDTLACWERFFVNDFVGGANLGEAH